MSNEEQPQEPVQRAPASEYECSMCGRDGGPVASCQLCLGNQRFVQKRHFTLSEERRGLNPEEKSRRYGALGEVGPEQIHDTNIVMPRR
jgi:hypothetical protein